MRIAILDDYQRVALASADWTALDAAEVTPFHAHIADTADLVAELRPFDVIVAMRERTPFTAERIRLLPGLRLLVTTGMANASIDLAAADAAGVTVCGTRGSAGATPELTWALILALVRHVPEEDRRIRAGGWQQTVGFGLRGRTLGVVGLGTIGRRVAAVGLAFGMEVLGWSQNLSPAVAAEAGVSPVGKDELFAVSDVITVHYKLSERSAGLIGARELGLMKPTAFLVNTSRGPIVDEDALLASLHAGAIAGAALDVYDEEPLPGGHPLRVAPRTVLTPHVGYVTDDGYRAFYGDAVEDIAAFAAGRPVRVLGTGPR
ncbi:D-2-hydroxyacid dehydrogenase family protein [Trebonia sp.]|uniref:D-2-hydroxyacid dehydrogenase family protein n=1 Tax=Trebonia sp. TaxID=2767075 RepID=UPI00263704DC|nr:D-2-hydroxyacid dehydrogenase family protein [Trebonia sp.]